VLRPALAALQESASSSVREHMEPGQGGAGPSVDHRREPCPDRIIDDVGGAFGMGAVGGGVWHLVKGIKNSPSGARMLGGVQVWQLDIAHASAALQR
jgi:hypothetical protein